MTNESASVTHMQPEEHKRLRRTIILGYTLGGLGLAGLFVCAIFITGNDHITLNPLLCICGGALGCAPGIFFSPLDPSEKKEFSEYGMAIWTFLSGYVLATAGAIFDQASKNGEIGFIFISRSLLFVSAFILVALFWFVAREYLCCWKAARPLWD